MVIWEWVASGVFDDENIPFDTIDLAQSKKKEHVVDIIYSPSKTKLIRQANNLDIPNINGLGMLLYQGCEAFKFWTGEPAPEDVMLKQLHNLVN